MFADLNPILHSQLRLAIISLLVKLEAAGYVSVKKTFKDNYPNTQVQLTPQGLSAFEQYVEALKSYIFNP